MKTFSTMTDADLQLQAAVGRRIGELLESSEVKAAVTAVRADLISEWVAGADVPAREAAHGTFLGLNRLMEMFEQLQIDGQGAQETIRKRDEKAKRDA